MPAWWPRKSSKKKERQQQESHAAAGHQFNFIKSPIRNGAKKEKDKPKSFDEVSAVILPRNSPRGSRDFTSAPAGVGGSSSGFCDSDGGEKRGLPLPRPSVSSIHSFEKDQPGGLGSASISGSSVSSTGSYDDHPISQSNGSR